MARVQTFECASVHWRIGAITKDVQNACMHAPQSSRTHLNLHDWDGRRVGHTPAQSGIAACSVMCERRRHGCIDRSHVVCATRTRSPQARNIDRRCVAAQCRRPSARPRVSEDLQIRNLRIEAAMHDPKMASRISIGKMELASTLGAHPSSLNSPIPDLHSLPLPLGKSEVAESRLQSTSRRAQNAQWKCRSRVNELHSHSEISIFTPPRRPQTGSGEWRSEFRERIGNKIQDVSCMGEAASALRLTALSPSGVFVSVNE